ncbi:MAG: extracellular solute-binding protein [Clostridia bacterium]|nr:extracellular solute-binding protein [Clostridia bacterium]
MKKQLSLLLAGCMLGITACGGTSPANSDTTAPSTDTGTTVAETSGTDLFSADYENYNFRILTANAESNTWFTSTLTVMEDEGDVFSSAVYKRNQLAEEALNITITEEYQEIQSIRAGIMAGDDTADLLLIHGSNVLAMAQEGALHDLLTLPHQDFEAKWWDTNAAEQLSIAGSLYFGVGDFITTANDETIVTFFNKQLLGDLKLEDPYQLVADGEWTLDKMMEMGKAAMRENGDTVYNDQDTYGLLGHQNMLYIYLICGSGETIITKDKDDIPAFTFNNERFTEAYLKVLNVIHGNGEGFLYDANVKQNTMGLSNNHRVQEIMFPNNQSLFWVETVSWANDLRDMDAYFGILPCPKHDKTQDEYSNLNNGSFYGMSVPITVSDIDRTSYILEALNAFSTDTVQSAYYEISLKGKITRDEESSAMLDLIFGNRTFDCSVTYSIARMRHGICAKALENDTNIASYYASQQSAIESQLNDIVEAFQK